MAKELKKYHEAELIDARGADKNVHVRTHNGKLLIDVDESGQRVHVICPIATLEDISEQLDRTSPPI